MYEMKTTTTTTTTTTDVIDKKDRHHYKPNISLSSWLGVLSFLLAVLLLAVVVVDILPFLPRKMMMMKGTRGGTSSPFDNNNNISFVYVVDESDDDLDHDERTATSNKEEDGEENDDVIYVTFVDPPDNHNKKPKSSSSEAPASSGSVLIPPDYMGISVEWNHVVETFRQLPVQRLLRYLIDPYQQDEEQGQEENDDMAVVASDVDVVDLVLNIRVGGNSADRTWWWNNSDDAAGRRNHNHSSSCQYYYNHENCIDYDLTPQDVTALFQIAKNLTNTTLILDLNMIHLPWAIEEWKGILQTISLHDFQTILEGIEIGNEPNLFPSHGMKPPTYSFQQYSTEFLQYIKALEKVSAKELEQQEATTATSSKRRNLLLRQQQQQQQPNINSSSSSSSSSSPSSSPFSLKKFIRGGTFCCSNKDFNPHQPKIMKDFQLYLYSWSYHHYPVHNHQKEEQKDYYYYNNNTNNLDDSYYNEDKKNSHIIKDAMEALLNDQATEGEANRILHWSTVAQSLGIQFHMGECNSIPMGGIKGVSDTLAATLWAVDFMFELAANGKTTRINFHGGGMSSYSWFYWLNETNSVQVQPIYYAMFVWNWITAPTQTHIVPISCHGKACEKQQPATNTTARKWCQDGIKSDRICCAKECGGCGGHGCERFPGGPNKCCTSVIRQNGITCQTPASVGCKIPLPPTAKVKVWAVQDHVGNTKIIIINKMDGSSSYNSSGNNNNNKTRTKTTKIQLRVPYRKGEMVILKANKGKSSLLNATKHISFAGWTWKHPSSDGKRIGKYNSTKIVPIVSSSSSSSSTAEEAEAAVVYELQQGPASIMVLSFSYKDRLHFEKLSSSSSSSLLLRTFY